jgi:hypothetical protein
MSHRQLSDVIVLAELQDGWCQASGNTFYPNVTYGPVPGNPTGDALRDWCKSWCAQVEPDKVVGISTYDENGSSAQCYCFFSTDKLPADFATDFNAFKAKYVPGASSGNTNNAGVGCIAAAANYANYKCFQNCAYSQCISAHLCFLRIFIPV